MSSAPLWGVATSPQVLVVDPAEEDPALTAALSRRGVGVTWVRRPADALVVYGHLLPHAVVVAPETGDPAMPPARFVATIRRYGSPYVVAAVAGAPDREAAELLEAGASTWVSWPCSATELWERLASAPVPLRDRSHLVVGPLELDTASYQVHVAGERIPDLPLKEFELLHALMLRAPDVVDDDDLRVALWGAAERAPSGNTIAMHVARLRARLAPAATLRRIRGRGYALTVDD
ncbi:response regulator transcription factor [Nocardioides litoris]|uniref:response regulator transcription factor n=1 Tax=Nocardioides litoris TaxID=1926648 RepID=UPI001121CB77|nr:winged helix-turn-helix domain-containing protein [Nocardioides litoris]